MNTIILEFERNLFQTINYGVDKGVPIAAISLVLINARKEVDRILEESLAKEEQDLKGIKEKTPKENVEEENN